MDMIYYVKETFSEGEEGDIDINQEALLIDDKAVEGDTLAARRLKIKAAGVPLYKLSKALFFIGDFIKVSVPKQWFIDSNGKIFTHAKTTRASLVCQKITGSFIIGTGGAIIEVEYSQRYKVLHTPGPNIKYAGILTQGFTNILYGLYEEPFDETWRMI